MTKEEQLAKKKAGEDFVLTSTDEITVVQKSLNPVKEEEKKEEPNEEVKEEAKEEQDIAQEITPDVKIEGDAQDAAPAEEKTPAALEPEVEEPAVEEPQGIDAPTVDDVATDIGVGMPDVTASVPDMGATTTDTNMNTNGTDLDFNNGVTESDLLSAFAIPGVDMNSIEADDPLAGLNLGTPSGDTSIDTTATGDASTQEDTGFDYNSGLLAEGSNDALASSNAMPVNTTDIPKDIKYFKNPDVIPEIMQRLEENIVNKVREIIREEIKDKILQPLQNTAIVGEKSYNLADDIIKNGSNLRSYKEYESITDIRENGLEAANDIESDADAFEAPLAVDAEVEKPSFENQNLFGEEPSKVIPFNAPSAHEESVVPQFNSPFNPFGDQNVDNDDFNFPKVA